MTSLHERIDIDFDLDDPTVEGTQPVVAPGNAGSDGRLPHDVTAAPKSRKPFRTWIISTIGRVRSAFARPPRSERPAKRHYPPRFSLEFDSSLVDRERRRL